MSVKKEESTEAGETRKWQVGAARDQQRKDNSHMKGIGQEAALQGHGHHHTGSSPNSASNFLVSRVPTARHTSPSWLTHCLGPMALFYFYLPKLEDIFN